MRRSDGGYEGPIHSASIEAVRKQSGAWTPLYTAQQPALVQAVQEPAGRSEREIVDQTEVLAKFLLSWKWGQEPESPLTTMRDTVNAKGRICWQAACHIQELLTGTDVENAVAEVDDVSAAPQPIAQAVQPS